MLLSNGRGFDKITDNEGVTENFLNVKMITLVFLNVKMITLVFLNVKMITLVFRLFAFFLKQRSRVQM